MLYQWLGKLVQREAQRIVNISDSRAGFDARNTSAGFVHSSNREAGKRHRVVVPAPGLVPHRWSGMVRVLPAGTRVEIDAPARLNQVAPIKDTFRPTARDRIGFLDPR
jgi:hypothetical protein